MDIKKFLLLGVVFLLMIGVVNAESSWNLLQDFEDCSTLQECGFTNLTEVDCSYNIVNGQLVIDREAWDNPKCQVMTPYKFNTSNRMKLLMDLHTNTGANHYITFGMGNDGISNGKTVNGYSTAYITAGVNYWRYYEGGSSIGNAEVGVMNDDTWYWYEFLWNSSASEELQTYQWLNSSTKGAKVGDLDRNALTSTGDYLWIQNDGDTSTYTGVLTIEEIWVWNETVIHPAQDTLNMSSQSYPVNNTQFSKTDMNFSILVNSTYAFNCSLYLNDVLNDSASFSAGTNVNASIYVTGLPSSQQDYYFTCYNATGFTHAQKNSSVVSIYTDAVIPNINAEFSLNQILFTNGTLGGQFNFSDDFNLFSYNLSIDGLQIAYLDNINDVSAQYNLSYNTENLTVGQHTLNVTTADGHTAKELKGDYIVNDGLFNDYIEYEFYDKGKVKIKGLESSWFDAFTTERETDRYTFSYAPATKKTSYTFTVESDDPMYIANALDNKKYGGEWLIMGNHWLDFFVEEEPNLKVEITLINDYEAEVTVSGISAERKKIKFKSIGDLNIITQSYNFTVTRSTITYEAWVIEQQTQEINFYINNTNINYTDVVLVYNNTEYTGTETIGASFNSYVFSFTTPGATLDQEEVPFYFNVNISGAVESTQTYNQTVYKINIGNCSNATWAKALTFYSKDEENDNLLNNLSLNIDLGVWFDSESSYKTFSFAFRNQNNYSICLYPNETTYKLNAILEYEEEDNKTPYSHRKYYLWNYTLDNVEDEINLYSLLNSKSSDIILNVYDQITGASVDGAYIKILRYYPDLATYKTVEIERTDELGKTLAKMQLADVFYKFIIEKDGVIVLNSDVQKILSTTKLLPVSISENVLESFEKIDGVNVNVSCTQTTNVCRFTWSDTQNIVRDATLKIWKYSSLGKVLEYTKTTSSSAGTMTYTINDTTSGTTYKAEGWIDTSTQYSDYNVGIDDLIFSESLANWGGLSVFLPILLLIITISFALIDIGAIGVILGSLISLVTLAIFNIVPFSPTFLMSFIIMGGLLIAKIKQ